MPNYETELLSTEKTKLASTVLWFILKSNIFLWTFLIDKCKLFNAKHRKPYSCHQALPIPILDQIGTTSLSTQTLSLMPTYFPQATTIHGDTKISGHTFASLPCIYILNVLKGMPRHKPCVKVMGNFVCTLIFSRLLWWKRISGGCTRSTWFTCLCVLL